MMLRRVAGFVLLSLVGGTTAVRAQIVRVADLNTAQIRALDRTKTVVFLPGGMLEEHGPYLPAFTDGILSERLTDELARAAVARSRAGRRSSSRRCRPARAARTSSAATSSFPAPTRSGRAR